MDLVLWSTQTEWVLTRHPFATFHHFSSLRRSACVRKCQPLLISLPFFKLQLLNIMIVISDRVRPPLPAGFKSAAKGNPMNHADGADEPDRELNCQPKQGAEDPSESNYRTRSLPLLQQSHSVSLQ